MTTALVAGGYKNIAFLGEAEDDWTRAAERRKGFIDAMEQEGLSAHRLVKIGKPPISIEDGASAFPGLLAQYPDTDCIFCVSDPAAFGALSGLKAAGRSVPGDMGVAGFSNFEVSCYSIPKLTAVTVDPNAIGTETGRMIAQLRVYPNKGTESTTGIDGVHALSACSFLIASG